MLARTEMIQGSEVAERRWKQLAGDYGISTEEDPEVVAAREQAAVAELYRSQGWDVMPDDWDDDDVVEL
mgnify:CR=1 FL=1